MSNIKINQLLVAGSALLAAIPVGCSVNYPNVLLRQLAANDSSIYMDKDTASWIGSINGIGAIPSVLMPAFMQWKGRKLAFILACLVSIIGWIIAFTATTSTAILISESLHGFGSQSIMTVGLLTMSEMLSPRIRNVTIGSYLGVQTFAMALVGIIGNYLHWRTVTLVVCAPLIVTVLAACMWPESPSWLACKGEFDKCTKSFKRLRGTGDTAQAELEELILAQKENLSRDNKRNRQNILKRFCKTLKSRDFCMPGIHIFVLAFSVYWVGELALIIYSSDIIQRATFTNDTVIFGNTVLNMMLFLGTITGVVTIRYFKPKMVLLGCSSCTVLALLIASGINYFQTAGLLSKETHTSVYMIFSASFTMNVCCPIVMAVCAELMPVKHRGVGGPLHVLIYSFMHTSSLKLTPYILRSLNLWGLCLLYAVCGTVSNLYIWYSVPETKGKTLQELEDHYTYGSVKTPRCLDLKEDLQEL